MRATAGQAPPLTRRTRNTPAIRGGGVPRPQENSPLPSDAARITRLAAQLSAFVATQQHAVTADGEPHPWVTQIADRRAARTK